MNDILFGNNNSKVITKLSKRYFKKNKVRNLAALLAIILTAFLFTSITSLAFNMASSIQLSLQMQKGSKADGTLGYMTEEQYEQLVNSDFVEQAGHRRIIGYASNTSSHSIEINYADSVQQELTFCVPTHGAAPEKANEIATTDLALKALGVEPEIGAEVPLEFELRGKTYHYDMVLSGWWEASNDSVSVATVSEQFIKENPDVVQNTYAVAHEMSGVTFSDVVVKNKANAKTIFFIKSSPAFLWCYLFGLFLCLGCFSLFHAQNQDGRNNNSKHKTARTGSDIPVDCGIIATVAYHSETCGNRIKVC